VDSLSDKLKMLGVRKGAQDLKPAQSRATYPVEDVIPGQFIQTSAGSVYLVENNYPRQHLHGITSLELNNSLNIIAEWAGHPEIAATQPEAIAFLWSVLESIMRRGLRLGNSSWAILLKSPLFYCH
jgi:hypothetical protein